MQITNSAKYSQLFCVVLLLCIVYSSAQKCNSDNLTSAEYESNLNIVLKNLVNNTSSSNGFNTSVSGQSPDSVYGLLQCMGDTTMEECFSCSQNIAKNIRESCKNATGVRNLQGKCFLRYDNYSFFGILDTNTSAVYNTGKITDEPDVFRNAVRGLFNNLSELAIESQMLYSSGSTTTSTSYITINSQVQCWRDLTSAGDCKICLSKAKDALLGATFREDGTFQGGVGWTGSCFVRYETYEFFNPSPPPPPSPLAMQQPPLSPPTAVGK